MNAVLLASGPLTKTLWDPTILGVLTVIAAIALFCGSVYLLLTTNLGASLGFLVAAACVTGFMVLLSAMWITTQTPLNSPHGSGARWRVVELVDEPASSSVASVRTIQEQGNVVANEDLATLKPEVDTGIVQPSEEGEEAPEPSEFVIFSSADQFLIDADGLQSYYVGGGFSLRFFDDDWVNIHEPRYAAVEFCPVLDEGDTFPEPPPEPECDPNRPTGFVILARDLGTQRKVPVYWFLGSLVLFALCLLGLHWREKDLRAARAAADAETRVPTA